MNINIIASGLLKNSIEEQIGSEFLKRITSWKINVKEFSNNINIEKEAESILSLITSPSVIIALDVGGIQMTSEDFASFINKYHETGIKNVCFIIGGANGISSRIKKITNKSISFGLMTFPHKIVRILLMEQLYRAQSIINNHPYHK